VGRTRVVTQLQALARANEAVVEVDIAPDVRFGSGVRFLVQRGTRNVVRLGPGCRVFEDVTFELRGGQLLLGENVEVRRGSYMGIGGRFECQARNIISYYNLIHCAESIVLEEYASTNEFVSLIDSTHHHDGPSEFFYENVSAAPIHVGPNVWICSKATVLMGVTIGPNSVVASHAVVNRDVPPGVVVGGLPARVLGERAVDGPALRFFG
jgi:acetyltransferase-like isoleucine patch superfamily enzyme